MMKQYHDMLNHILNVNQSKEDRTGTGTLSTFGYQTRYNLNDGFPLVTTKKIHLKSIIHELLWFLAGDTNTKYLQDNGVKIWNEWAAPDGNLGPVYGKMWRAWDCPEQCVLVNQRLVSYSDTAPLDVTKIEYGRVYPFKLEYPNTLLYPIWRDILQKVLDTSQYHGNDLLMLHKDWNDFDLFCRDVKQLPNWFKFLASPEYYALDISYYQSNGYSKNTCVWLSTSEQRFYQSKKSTPFHYIVDRNTVKMGLSVQRVADELNISKKIIKNALKQSKPSNDESGRVFFYAQVFGSVAGRYALPIDQMSDLIDEIKTNPSSRRLIISGWNPSVLPDPSVSPIVNVTRGKQALPPCHTLCQFYVDENDRLSCQLYQRSADAFLGVPFNIASYALLTMMIAQVCNLKLGEFIHTFGDLHIYNNHIDQVNELLTRDCRPLPTLTINPKVDNIFDFVYDDFILTNYDHHPAIKAPIAI